MRKIYFFMVFAQSRPNNLASNISRAERSRLKEKTDDCTARTAGPDLGTVDLVDAGRVNYCDLVPVTRNE